MSWFARTRSAVGVLAVGTALAAVAMPALAADLDATREAWTRSRAATAEAIEGLEHLDLATIEASAAYDAVVAQLEAERTQLRRLRADLTAAKRRLATAEEANDVAIRRLGQATMVMVTTASALDEHVDDLEVEVAAAYKYAGSSARFRGVVDALLDSASLSEFSIAYEQLRTSTRDQHGLVETVTAMAKTLREQRFVVEAMQRESARIEREAQEERDAVANLTRQQQDLVEQIAADEARSARLLKRLERQRAIAAERLDALQVQTEQLTEELRAFGHVAGVPGTGDLLWPTDGASTSGFGMRAHPILNTTRLHAGIDIPAPTGQPVYSAGDGVVISAGPRGGYGNVVVIDHGDSVSTVYAHLNSISVTSCQAVDAAVPIGTIGTTGLSTGPHLHFEVRVQASPVDPMSWF